MLINQVQRAASLTHRRGTEDKLTLVLWMFQKRLVSMYNNELIIITDYEKVFDVYFVLLLNDTEWIVGRCYQ